MSREVPFDPLAICDVCGDIGAYDFMGDYLCQRCVDTLDHDYSNEQIEDDDEEIKD